MKYAVFFLFVTLSACSTYDVYDENPFAKYPAKPIFRDEVYDNAEWLADCETYVMEECFY